MMTPSARYSTLPTSIRLVRTCGFLIVILAARSLSASNAILDTGGFAANRLGPLVGQSIGSHTWTTIGAGGGSAVVDMTSGMGGTQGLHVTRAGSSDDWWGVSYHGQGLPTNRYVVIDWDMQVANSTASAGTYGPFVGMQAYDDSLVPSVLGTLGVDATTRDVLIQEAASGVLVESGVKVDETWHHYSIRLDFLGHAYHVFVDNSPVALPGMPFVDGLSDTFTDATIAAFAAGADTASQQQPASANFDNLLVIDTSLGDINSDGTVDAADANLMFQAWGALGKNAADLTMDQIVDAADASELFAAWTGDGVAAVPEPMTGWPGALGMLVAWSVRRLGAREVIPEDAST